MKSEKILVYTLAVFAGIGTFIVAVLQVINL